MAKCSKCQKKKEELAEMQANIVKQNIVVDGDEWTFPEDQTTTNDNVA